MAADAQIPPKPLEIEISSTRKDHRDENSLEVPGDSREAIEKRAIEMAKQFFGLEPDPDQHWPRPYVVEIITVRPEVQNGVGDVYSWVADVEVSLQTETWTA